MYEKPSEDPVNPSHYNENVWHGMQGPPGYRCACGAVFDNYEPLAEHVRWSIGCPCCGGRPAVLRKGEAFRWVCGHWIARGDASATIHADDHHCATACEVND